MDNQNEYLAKDWANGGVVVGTVVRVGKQWIGTYQDGTTTEPFATLKAATAAMIAAKGGAQ